MSADDECEEWSEATEAKSKRVIRMTGRVLSREEVRALLDEGKRIATEKRKAREARERDPEKCR